MKIRFKSVKDRQEFSTSRANVVIAQYMGMDTHEARNYPNGHIKLIDDEGYDITIPDPYMIGFDGWYATIHMDERSYFDIEGE